MIEKFRVNCAKLFPILISRWIHSWKKAKDFDLKSLKIVGSGGTKVRPEYIKWILNQGWEFVNIFGMAEGPIIMTRHQFPDKYHLHTIGKPLIQSPEVDLKLVNEKNQEIHGIGEMKMKGPITFKGYFRNPEENSKAFDQKGYFHSGDLMSQREDGLYVVEGRIKDMIKRGGENVYPEPIQDLLTQHPKILAAACVGMPDPVTDERLVAFVQTVSKKSFTLEEMREYMEEKGVGIYKWPERLEIVQGWPLTAANKIAKRLLRAWITTKLYTEGKITKTFGNNYLKSDKITIEDVLSKKIKIMFSGTPR
jgi:2,3-dihydroxybenzoate-AMP ligase